MKKALQLILTFVFLFAFSSLNAQTYCIPTYTHGCESGNGMVQVHLNTISQTIPCSDIPNYYHDFTATGTDLAKNGYYILSGQTLNTNFFITVWIDYNNNSTFESGIELVGSYSFSNPGGSFTIPFSVPGTVSTGARRLRIMSSTGNFISDPCFDPGYGNSCDFTVNIVPPVTPPSVVTQGATGIMPTTAIFNGSVNAHSNSTQAEFHYGTDLNYGYTMNAVPSVITGNSTTNVTCSPSGLLPNTTYHCELVGFGAGGYVSGGDITFTTDPLPAPVVTTLGATAITGVSAILNGTVNAKSSVSTTYFEYGTTPSYGRTISGNPSSLSTGTPEPVNASITGLTLNTIYHYRLVSTNVAGTTFGDDMTFSTLPTLYCTPVFNYGCANINMGTTYFGLNNIAQNIECSGSPNYYHDYSSSASADLALGNSYPITVVSGYGANTVTVWIDYNQNNIFDGASEVVGNAFCNNAGTPYTFPITIPPSALTGTTRLRVMTIYYYSNYSYPSDPCSTSEYYGNCADFAVNILSSAAPCTATTLAASGISGANAALNGTINANGFETGVFFDYGLTSSYTATIPGVPSVATGSAPASITAAIGGLLPNTTYHFRVRGNNGGGITNGADMSFTSSPLLPVVTTGGASGIGGTTATLNGTVDANNSSSAVSFEYGPTSSYGSTVTADPSSISGHSAQSVAAQLSGLVLNTTYHYRIVSTNEAGTSYGEDLTFNTLATPYCIPVFNYGCVNINMGLTYFGLNAIAQDIECSGSPNYYHDYSALVSADLALGNTYAVTVVAGYGANTVTVWIDFNHNNVFDGTSEVVGNVFCNNAGTPYTFQITIPPSALTGSTRMRVMTNFYYSYYTYPYDPCSTSEYYGNCADFTVNLLSSAIACSATSVTATGLAGSGATLNGTINANGFATGVFFDYGLTDSYGTTLHATPAVVAGSAPTDVTGNITGLLPNTIYHFRVRGNNAGGTTAGDDLTLNSSPVPPVAATGGITSLGGTTATLNGSVDANNSGSSVAFEYGLTDSYGSTITAAPATINGHTVQAASAPISGLDLNTLYHYRIVSTNEAGTSYGEDKSFTTLATPYCIPVFAYGCANINMGTTYFELNTIQQHISCSGSPEYYHDYTSSAQADVAVGGTYSITVVAGYGMNTTTVWIDYNHNNVFDGAAEVVGNAFCYTAGIPYSIPLTIPAGTLTGSTRLRVMTNYYYMYYAYPYDPCSTSEYYGNCADFTVNILSSATPCSATTVAASGISGPGATLNGTINANGYDAGVFFDYGLTNSYGTTIPASIPIVSGSIPVDVNAPVTGLLPNTSYHFRVRGNNAGGITSGDDLSFTSSPVPPIVLTGGISGLGGTSVTFSGTVDANNSVASVAFEYGLTTLYGATVTATPSSISGHSAQGATAFVNGLNMNTLYHYRIVSTNEAGTTYGDDMTFTTLPTPYCIPVFGYGCANISMGLTYFGLNAISQDITCSGSPNYYHDYSPSLSTNLAQGGTYTISVVAGYGMNL
ncbi:MAG: GEVED domain-containing protein, partial [Bacteroidota bacterium]